MQLKNHLASRIRGLLIKSREVTVRAKKNYVEISDEVCTRNEKGWVKNPRMTLKQVIM